MKIATQSSVIFLKKTQNKTKKNKKTYSNTVYLNDETEYS